MIPEFQFRIVYNPAWDAYDVYLMGRDTASGREMLLPPTWEVVTVPEGAKYPEPTFHISTQQARAIIGQLSGYGVKPPDVSLAEGKLEATERHLQDLRILLKLRDREVSCPS